MKKALAVLLLLTAALSLPAAETGGNGADDAANNAVSSSPVSETPVVEQALPEAVSGEAPGSGEPVPEDSAAPDETPVPSSGSALPSTETPPPDAASQVDAASQAAETVNEDQLNTLRFGTETEIAALIQTLKQEKNSSLDSELIEVARETRNRSILSGIFSFFGEMEKTGLEDRAMRAIKERDDEANETVMAAVDYLGRVRAVQSVDHLEELVNAGESRFLNTAFRALGRIGKGRASETSGRKMDGDTADKVAGFLLEYYSERNPDDENRREIIFALGETGSKTAVSFLASMVSDTEERVVLRMTALEAIAKIGDDKGLDAVIEAVSSTDPNVRSSAVSALGPFSGEAVESAILEGFRDSYYRTRIGAAQAASKRRLESAVPYLRYRAEKDEVPVVKDEAVRALGAINNAEAMNVLDSLFNGKKNTDRIRVLAAEMLLKNDADKYGKPVAIEMEEARNKNQTPLYNGFVRVLTAAKSGSLEDLARRLIASGGVIEKSLALDLILNNEFRGLAGDVRTLFDEKKSNASIARKARSTLEKLGVAEDS